MGAPSASSAASELPPLMDLAADVVEAADEEEAPETEAEARKRRIDQAIDFAAAVALREELTATAPLGL